MTRPLGIVLAIELLVAVAFGQMGHVYSPATTRAFREWQQHPSPETLQAFEKQKHITEWFNWGMSATAFALMAGVTIQLFRTRSNGHSRDDNQPAKSNCTTAL